MGWRLIQKKWSTNTFFEVYNYTALLIVAKNAQRGECVKKLTIGIWAQRKMEYAEINVLDSDNDYIPIPFDISKTNVKKNNFYYMCLNQFFFKVRPIYWFNL